MKQLTYLGVKKATRETSKWCWISRRIGCRKWHLCKRRGAKIKVIK